MITILLGKSGSGKDTIQSELCKQNYKRFITATSRPMRDNEIDGIDYYFMTKEQFINCAETNQFIEYHYYNTLYNGVEDVWWYGTPKTELSKDENYVIILDMDSIQAFIDYYGKDNCFVVYIDTSDNIRAQRALQRGTFNYIEWNRRLKLDNNKFDNELVNAISNKIITNSINTTIIDIVNSIILSSKDKN